jgi:hypothetical protein
VEVIFPRIGAIVPALFDPPFDIGERRRKDNEYRKIPSGIKIAYLLLVGIYVDKNWQEKTVSDGSGG